MRKWLLCLLPLVLLGAALVVEVRTSLVQSQVFPRLASEMSFQVETGPSHAIRFPDHGPHNLRNGYVALPDFTRRLETRGFAVSHQARFSPRLLEFVDHGGNPPYREKIQTGLTIRDDDDIPLFIARHPQRVYGDFSQIPPLLVDALLHIENRELLNRDHPRHNPAIEWDRLAEALFRQAGNRVLGNGQTPGGSTLATQLEKYRHSPRGQTPDITEKLRQMVSATVRAYSEGPDTTLASRRIVRDYVNTTPLAGRPGYGEVHGIGDGLWVWFGIDFPEANALLSLPPAADDEQLTEQARVFKATLSLLLAQRRPSHLLIDGRGELARLTDSHLRLLGDAGIIDARLRDAALAQPLVFRHRPPLPTPPSFVEQKAVNSVRTELLAALGLDSLYALDKLDLAVKTTVLSGVQEEVTRVLKSLKDEDFARANGLLGERMPRADQLGTVDFSVLLYERTARGNLLRVQADNLDRPFDLNDSSKLDLGSTAKLRTLATYLEVIDILHQRYAALPAHQRPEAESVRNDPLRQWVLRHLQQHPGTTLAETLDAAMGRTYSAHTGERFFTAGGAHFFNNFDNRDNHRVMTVAEAFNRSVNLVFIRMMRDIARFHIAEISGVDDILSNANSPLRQQYLKRFADMEGRDFLRDFHRAYRGKTEQQRIALLAQRTQPAPRRLAMAFRAVYPEASSTALADFLAMRLDAQTLAASDIEALYGQYDPARFNSNDQAYLAGVHPLELWLAAYLREYPDATLGQVFDASREARQVAYTWLFRTSRWNAQQNRIRIVLEQDAFEAIHRQWQRLGYPFPRLTPSYATALGASADRPSALAELMGIIINHGWRLPTTQIDSLVFAAGTPYETAFRHQPVAAEQVLSPEVSDTLRRALVGVVESGTARRLNGVFRDARGEPLEVGGKTGTGDHRNKRFASGGRLLESQVVNRNAIFTFFIGDRYFGTIVAHVAGPRAQHFDFTSGLAAQLLKTLAPAFEALPGGESPLVLDGNQALSQSGHATQPSR